jgi:hypothetical protein
MMIDETPIGQGHRLPDFVVIGTMKSGTTSLYRWMGSQSEIFLPELKEVNFFAVDDEWIKGLDWYQGLFSGARDDQLVGEISGSCTCPRLCEKSSGRMADLIPNSLLIYVLRDPIERLRSHYRHQVQRGRERRSLRDALLEPDSEYIGHSLYFQCLEPYLKRFDRGQICVLRFEDLTGETGAAWGHLMTSLGLPDRPRPSTVYNVTGGKDQFSRLLLWLWQQGALPRLSAAPRPLRRIGKMFLSHRGRRYQRRLEQSFAPISESVLTTIWEDTRQLEQWLGVEALWFTRPNSIEASDRANGPE